MKTLYLLRHAHAAPSSAERDADHARQLTEEGEAAAVRVGAYMKAHDYFPDFILSSSAVRTLQTVRGIMGRLLRDPGQQTSSHFDRSLYLATPDALIESLRHNANDAPRVMLMGHNPGVAELALTLSSGAFADHAMDYSPATLSVFVANINAWEDFDPAHVKLEAVYQP